MRYKMTFLGLGVSNFSVLKNSFKGNHKDFFVSSIDKLSEEKKDYLNTHAIEFEEGLNSDRLLDTKTLMISPSVNPQHAIYISAKSNGIKVRTDIELFLENFETLPFMIAITGTNGKTTTVELIHHILNPVVKSYAVGNIGYSPYELINCDLKKSVLVFELSSFQIEHIKKNNKYFDIGGLTNIAQDHLDWHGNFEKYFNTKMALTGISKKVVLPEEFEQHEGFKYGFGKNSDCIINWNIKKIFMRHNKKRAIIDLTSMKIQGLHNAKNSALAAYCCFLYGLDEKSIQTGLNSYKSGEHRMEFFLEAKGRLFINDSKSTNAHSLLGALNFFEADEKNIILLTGAKDKGDDYSELTAIIGKKVKKSYLCGESAGRMFDMIGKEQKKELFEDWESAIKKALFESSPGDIVLFSPGGSSFDKFENYKKRGKWFKDTIKLIIKSL